MQPDQEHDLLKQAVDMRVEPCKKYRRKDVAWTICSSYLAGLAKISLKVGVTGP